MTPIAPLIEAFLDETLARQRAVSRHTRDSYALSFQLLFSLVERKEIGGTLKTNKARPVRRGWLLNSHPRA
jgi:site-specific recombinase XerC